MNLNPYVATLEESLAAAAAAGDDGTRRTAAALTAALEPAVRLALMNALADAALEITDALGDRTVEIRLEGGEPGVVVSADPAEGDHHADPLDDAGEPSRITLRLPESLKSQAELSAAGQGVSLNTWLTRVVQEALRAERGQRTGGRETSGHRVRGWVQG